MAGLGLTLLGSCWEQGMTELCAQGAPRGTSGSRIWRLRLTSSVVSGLWGIWGWRSCAGTKLHLGSVSLGHSPSALRGRQGYLNQFRGNPDGHDPESSKGAEKKIVRHSTSAVLLVPVSSEELQLSVH